MSTASRYVVPIEVLDWEVPQSFSSTFRWEYSDGRESLLALYEKGKRQQWNASERIDWSQQLDPENPQQLPDESMPIRTAYAQMGILGFAETNLGEVSRNDERVAEEFDARRAEIERVASSVIA
jgi:hypothetical protein